MVKLEPLIITVALTGAEVKVSDNPYLPITPEQIAKDAIECYYAGARIAHIHVRDNEGNPSSDINLFKKVKDLINKEVPLLVQFTTGGAIGMTEDERAKVLELLPDMATLNMGSINFGNEVFINSPNFIEKLALKMKELNIKPEIEIYDFGMLETLVYYVKRGYIEEPVWVDFVLGIKGGAPAEANILINMVNYLKLKGIKFYWSVASVGKNQLPMNILAIVLGGNVRTGLEDNIYYHKGIFATNLSLTQRIVRIANEINRSIADIDYVINTLNIKSRLKNNLS
jgi:3-keto-5-aminohexanoate cleavage enzyme